MAWTKLHTYISLSFLVICIFGGFVKVGIDLANHDRVDLNEDSLDYILEIQGVSSESGYDSILETDSANSVSKGILDSEGNESVSDNNDFLSTLYIKKERISQPVDFFKLMYNFPSSLLIMMGFKINEFRFLVNLFSYVLFIAFIIAVWNWVRT